MPPFPYCWHIHQQVEASHWCFPSPYPGIFPSRYSDGSGYPNNLKGEEIPLGARILRVCDAFGALIANRPYRSAFDIETAISIMIEEVKNFDMRVFLTFQKVTQSEDMKNMLTRLGIS